MTVQDPPTALRWTGLHQAERPFDKVELQLLVGAGGWFVDCVHVVVAVCRFYS